MEEKKPKRPRIGALPTNTENTERESYQSRPYRGTERPDFQQRGFTPRPRRPYQQDNGYAAGGYTRHDVASENSEESSYNRQENSYNRQENSYNRQENGYNRQPRQYQPRQNGYGNQANHNGYSNYNNYGNRNNDRQQDGDRQTNYRPRQNNGYNSHSNYNSYGNRNANQRQNNYGQRQNGYGNQEGGYRKNNGGYQKNNGYQKRQQFGKPGQKPGQKFTPRPRRIEYEIEDFDPNEPIRLNKFIANSGICSRREADEKIAAGLVSVNDVVVTELGTKISRNDVIKIEDKVVTPEKKCYVLLNKPKDCVTTSDDPNGRLTVLDVVKGACQERIYPVGRLDRNTTGVLLLTNDGELASKLTHPKYVKKKIYHVWTDKDISEEDMQRIADGIELEDGEIHADAISYANDTDKNQAGIEIHSGKNRIVRRIFEHLGYRVTKLDRVYFAGLTKKNLPRGRWRYLTQEEVNFLRMGSFE